jgi:hypothetical protein
LLEECFCFGEGGAVAHGGDYFTRLDPDKQTRRLVAQLERLDTSSRFRRPPLDSRVISHQRSGLAARGVQGCRSTGPVWRSVRGGTAVPAEALLERDACKRGLLWDNTADGTTD